MKEQSHFRQTQEFSGPPELCVPTPRQVKWTQAGVINLVLTFLIVFVGFGIVSAIYGEAYQNHQLKDDGKETDAIVSRKWSESGKGIAYKVAYEFSAGGQTVRGESQIPRRNWQGLSAGSRMAIRYVPSEPAINRASTAYQRLLPYWVPLAAFAFWIWMITLSVFPLMKERRLLKFGQPVTGVITSNPGKRRPKYGYFVKYEFQLPDGSTVKGHTQRDGMYFSGHPHCVIYDPKRPRKNELYPLRMLRMRE